ncbi:MAG: DegT/DnrJ/EryC1/StrS family aminotransferase [Chthoniobacterales bacterium]|nr:DegT/DnrJ/EryC1/StrS family aminotransferase [Chthoniobacterales bacterium]
MNTAVVSRPSPSSLPLRARPKLGLGETIIGREEEELVLEVIRSKRLFRYTGSLPPSEQGKMATTLESETCALMGVRFALGVTSGTGALEVALSALEVGPGDEVIVPAWSWISCFSAIVRMGARPVLAEIDDTMNLAPGEITRLRTPKTKTVLIMHYQGVAADMDALMPEARAAGLRVLEDCAQSPGAMYHGKRVGAFGDIGIYSFQNNKCMTAGEGGLLVTDDPLLYERAVRMHDLGLYRSPHELRAPSRIPTFCGGQYRMNEMTAAVALAQLRKLDGVRAHCRRLSKVILDKISGLPGLTFRRIPDPSGDSGFEIYFYLPTTEQAEGFTKRLHARNVNCVKITGTYCQYERDYCIHRATYTPAASPFRDDADWPAPGYRKEDFPMTENYVHRFVCLPLGMLYTVEDAEYIAESVLAVYHDTEG